MKRTSPHFRTLIQQLYEPASLWEKLRGSRDDAAILSEIGDSTEPAAIVDVLPFVLASKPDVAAAAATSVHKLVLKATAQELVWLDCLLRRSSSYSGDSLYEWHNLRPDQLDLLERFGEASVSLVGIASFHQNGYVREAAIKRLDLITSGAELPFLILRLNDWVSNVRDAAYGTIRSRLRPEYARHFIANLALVSRLDEAGRADHKALIQAINELLQGDECRNVLLESLTSDDRLIRRVSFRLALNSKKSDLPEIVRHALNAQDTVIRLWAAQTVSSAFAGATLDLFLELMKRDRFMPVRREALRMAVKRNSPTSLAELRSALLDSHPAMREEARYHLRKLDPMDVAAFYRQSLSTAEGQTLYSVISGLGETGSAEDDPLIVPYTSHLVSKIRAAAIRALARLHGETHTDVFIDALKDEVPHVSRQALKALTDRASSLSGERIWKLFHLAKHAHVRRNALSLIEKLGKWESIHYLVRAVCDSDEDITAMSRFGIQRWLARFNRSFLSPTPEQLAQLNNALKECGDQLYNETMEQLQFSMKGFN
ncbi:MAG TPA: HEAT repeat domain-containing protein [Pyrinomonadaceae bacterium]|nr:HEAT repeat domain-containing protein [Pyrinomonadaceae bacterium]